MLTCGISHFKVSTFYILTGLLLSLIGAGCGFSVMLHAAMNESWNRSCAWLLTGAGFVYYVIFEFDSRFKWAVAGATVLGLGLGGTLFLKGAGIG